MAGLATQENTPSLPTPQSQGNVWWWCRCWFQLGCPLPDGCSYFQVARTVRCPHLVATSFSGELPRPDMNHLPWKSRQVTPSLRSGSQAMTDCYSGIKSQSSFLKPGSFCGAIYAPALPMGSAEVREHLKPPLCSAVPSALSCLLHILPGFPGEHTLNRSDSVSGTISGKPEWVRRNHLNPPQGHI